MRRSVEANPNQPDHQQPRHNEACFGPNNRLWDAENPDRWVILTVASLVAAATSFICTYIQLRRFPTSFAAAFCVFVSGLFLIHRARRRQQFRNEMIMQKRRASGSSYNRELSCFKDMGNPCAMHGLSPDGFERFVLRYFQFLGYDTEKTASQNDGGIDGIVRQNGYTALVQCKRYARPINQAPVREFLGVLTKMGADAGYFVTTSSFGPGAKGFAHGTIVTLIDGETFSHMIQELPYVDPLTGSSVEFNSVLETSHTASLT